MTRRARQTALPLPARQIRRSQRGFTLVEIMVALVIGAFAVLIIQQVMALFEGQKRTSTGGADAQVNGAVALFAIEHEIRQAGYGLFGGEGSLCPSGINIYYDGTTIADGSVAAPVRIIDGGTGPDAIEFMRSNSDFAAIPTVIMRKIVNPTDPVFVNDSTGFSQNQIFLVVSKNNNNPCTLMQLSHAPALSGGIWSLKHESTRPYNPLHPGTAFSTPVDYGIGDIIVNMGSFAHRRFQLLCDRLTEVNPTATSAPWDCDNTDPVVDQIVDLQAQYGVAADADSVQVTQWCNASSTSSCGDWSSPDSAEIGRIRAIRIAVVARSTQYEKEEVSPAVLTLWEGGASGDAPPERALTNVERHYRYKIFSTIAPVRNAIWGSQ